MYHISDNAPYFNSHAKPPPPFQESTFDESQLLAINAMEHAFLLVQGPPGTGKSYVGVRMARLVYDLRNAVMEQKDKERQGNLAKKLQPFMMEQETAMSELQKLEQQQATLRGNAQEQQAHGCAHMPLEVLGRPDPPPPVPLILPKQAQERKGKVSRRAEGQQATVYRSERVGQMSYGGGQCDSVKLCLPAAAPVPSSASLAVSCAFLLCCPPPPPVCPCLASSLYLCSCVLVLSLCHCLFHRFSRQLPDNRSAPPTSSAW